MALKLRVFIRRVKQTLPGNEIKDQTRDPRVCLDTRHDMPKKARGKRAKGLNEVTKRNNCDQRMPDARAVTSDSNIGFSQSNQPPVEVIMHLFSIHEVPKVWLVEFG